VEFRAESVNISNYARFGLPNGGYPSPNSSSLGTCGDVTGANDLCIGLFALKFVFYSAGAEAIAVAFRPRGNTSHGRACSRRGSG
jgi:hypothetical protein